MTIAQETSSDVLRRAKIDLAASLRAAALYGYNEGIDNHFSFAVPGSDDLFLLNPFGPDWSELTASDLITVDGEGNVVDGKGEWEVTAFMIHRGAHRARPSARCVFHTHMPYAHRGRVDRRWLRSHPQPELHGLPRSRLDAATTAGSRMQPTRVTGSVGGGDDTSVVDAAKPRRAGDRKRRGRRLAKLLLPRASVRGAGARAVHRTAADRRPDRGGRGDRRPDGRPTRPVPRKLFAAVKRRLDRENPGYER